MLLHPKPSETSSRIELRQIASAWRQGETAKKSWKARLLEERFTSAVTTLEPMRALLGVEKAGKGLRVEQAIIIAYAALATVAHQVGVAAPAEAFGPSAILELSTRIALTCRRC